MESIPKCLLLPIDGSEEALLPIRFVSRLFPQLDQINLILSYFVPSLPPVYKQRLTSKEMIKKKKELLRDREKHARDALDHAKQILSRHGFSADLIQEHLQEKAMSVAHHACRLADIKKVDAVLVQKRVSSPLEGFLRDDPSNALLHYCIVSPVWFLEGEVDPSKAVICLQNEAASLRAADHAAFMLADTQTAIELLHVTHSAPHRFTSPAFAQSTELANWLKTEAGREISPIVAGSCDILKTAGIADTRVRITILPGREKEGKVAAEIIHYAKQHEIGIVVLGHSDPEGVWSFLKTSVTKKILGDFENMAVWVNQ
ncbi:MAG: universal stress protein [Desulforhabdus sp.]|jgi:nucleotide-binding universal stress UspA family protein|nr:universal stress protein [Desulforhabdus sp.]